MYDKKIMDLYTDYLICNMGLATATGLSNILDNQISHDKITRFISTLNSDPKLLWLEVKPLVRKLEDTDDGYMLIDDTIEEKPYTDENTMVCWHYSHSKHRNIKGINLLSALIRYGEISLPIDYHIVHKSSSFEDKNGKTKFKSDVSKNEIAREFISNAKRNHIKFKYVLADIWFSCNDNMQHINAMHKKFIFGCKSNRLIRFDKVWHKVGDLKMSDEQVIICYLKGLAFPVAISKKVFINEDLSVGELYIVSNDLSLSGSELYKVYQKRWMIEQYHYSIKENASLAKSPTKTVKTQTGHLLCTLFAFVKLESLKIKTALNHCALKGKLYISATKAALNQLQKFKLTAGIINC
jgi:hypothetical protein